MFMFDDSLAPELRALAWLVGRWRGQGMLSYPNIPELPFRQDVSFSHDGGPYLEYHSAIRVPAAGASVEASASPFGEVTFEADDATFTQVWAVESGYWRVVGPEPGDHSGATSEPAPQGADIEVMLAEPTGHASIMLGRVEGPRVELVSDAIVRTLTAADIQGTRRMYGLVGGELLWALDMAAFGEPLQSYAAGKLQRVDD